MTDIERCKCGHPEIWHQAFSRACRASERDPKTPTGYRLICGCDDYEEESK